MTSVAIGSIGVFGGTFDPIHYGHLAIAEEARESLQLAKVLFVPAGAPPHKPGRPITPADDRVAMVAMAIADHPAFELSLVEVDRPGPSYAVDTLSILVNRTFADGLQPDFVFVMSAEAVEGLPAWHEPRRLLELCRIAVVPRDGYALPDRPWLEEHFPGQEDRIIVLDGPSVAISASQIRDRVSRGRSIRYLVPPAVAAYIVDHRLYQSDLWRKAST